MTACIRRAGSEWTLCPCPECRVDQRRKAKRARNGLHVVNDQRDAARSRLDAWAAAGYSIGVVADMTGIRKATLARHLAGTRVQISHSTARRVMAADPIPGDAAGFMPSIGTVRRLRALTVMGWSMRDISERTGIKESTLHALRDPRHAITRPRYARAVRDVYDRLSMTKGDCRYAATRAIRKGWLPPLAWDDNDLDDPSAQPADAGEQGRGSLVDNIEFILEHEPYATTVRLRERLGYTHKTAISNALKRAGRDDLLAQLARNAEVAS